MGYGVSAINTHLDVRDPGASEPEEIDWINFKAWNGGKSPAFAGCYFLGQPWLFAHGEGTAALRDAPHLRRIAPIQRADADRQATEGPEGELLAMDDGGGLGAYVGACLDVGHVVLRSDFLYVFLEVGEPAALSADYWRGWASAVHDHMLISVTQGAGGIPRLRIRRPLLPCILCGFSRPDEGEPYAPVQAVRDCLAQAGAVLGHRQTRCYGFWARATDDPVLHASEPALDWARLPSYEQPQGKGTQTVPVLLWRYMDAADPAHPEVSEVGKLALDASRVFPDGRDRALEHMLEVETGWSTGATPTQLGVDTAVNLSSSIRCLTRTDTTLRHLPEGSDLGARPGPPLPSPLTGRTEFAVRYYSAPRAQANARSKDLTAAEAGAIARAGVALTAVYQHPSEDIIAHLEKPENGFDDAQDAFDSAARRIGQPPHTPIYFAIDEHVTAAGHELVSQYFENIRAGYEVYLAGDGAVPYYTGVYACRSVLDVLYARGLATHFWQAWPPPWGQAMRPGDDAARPNAKPWVHANFWQVVLGSAGKPFTDAGVVGCRPHATWQLVITGFVSGTFKLKIRGAWSSPIDLAAAEVKDLVEAVEPLPGVGGPGHVMVLPAAGRRPLRLRFDRDVGTVEMDATGLELGPGGVARVMDDGYVDLNVAWGDIGGWKPGGR